MRDIQFEHGEPVIWYNADEWEEKDGMMKHLPSGNWFRVMLNETQQPFSPFSYSAVVVAVNMDCEREDVIKLGRVAIVMTMMKHKQPTPVLQFSRPGRPERECRPS